MNLSKLMQSKSLMLVLTLFILLKAQLNNHIVNLRIKQKNFRLDSNLAWTSRVRKAGLSFDLPPQSPTAI